jgi:hypothetical protein
MSTRRCSAAAGVAAAGSLILASCATETDALCDGVEQIVDIRAEILRPDPVEIAERYRELALGYAEVARALDDEDAVETTFELAQLYDQSATVLDDHADADRDRLDELFAESETLVSLDQRMTTGEALGFTRPAWEEIDERCDIPVDPRAEFEFGLELALAALQRAATG